MNIVNMNENSGIQTGQNFEINKIDISSKFAHMAAVYEQYVILP